MLYICLCVIIDFVGFLFIITMLFYSPSNNNKAISSYFTTIRYIYLWEGIICIGSIIVHCASVAIIGLCCWAIFGLMDEGICSGCGADFTGIKGAGKAIFYGLFGMIVGIPASICGLVVVLIVVGIVSILAIIALAYLSTLWSLFIVATQSYSRRVSYTGRFYHDYLEWITQKSNSIEDEQGNTIISKKQNKKIKLCVLNQTILRQHPLITMDEAERNRDPYQIGWRNYYDTGLIDYIQQQQRNNFKSISLREMRQNCILDSGNLRWRIKNVNPFKQFGDEVYFAILKDLQGEFKGDEGIEKCLRGSGIIAVAILNYILGPIYFISKVFNLLMPFIIVLYLGVDGDINYFVDIDIFLVIMWFLYVIVIYGWVISLYCMLKEEYYAWHILPSTKSLVAANSRTVGATINEVRDKIDDNYVSATLYPLIEIKLTGIYGGDVTHLVMDYLNNIQVSSREQLIESLLDDLFGIDITDVILDYHNNIKVEPVRRWGYGLI